VRRFMIGLSHAMQRRRWLVIAAWVALVAFSIPFSQRDNENLSAGLSGIEGTQSQTVQDAMDAGDFGSAGDPGAGVVVQPARGATAQQVEAAVTRIQDAVRTTQDAVPLSDDDLRDAQEEAQAGRPFIVAVKFRTTQADSVSDVQDLIDTLDAGDVRDGVTLYVVGQSALQAEQIDESNGSADTASAVSIPVILIMLLAAFGALVAALVPLVFGFSAVVVTGMAIFFLSKSLTISIFATSLSAMIGLAVAVDYSLFILMRYREELSKGKDRGDALAEAMSTSAIAVMFSGTTVIVSLLGLLLVPNATVRSMALGAVIVVAVALLGAATLLPAIIAAVHRGIDKPGRIGHALSRLSRPGFWTRWGVAVTRRPWVTVVGVLAVLLLVAYPFVKITLNESTVLQLPEDNQARVGTDLAAQIAGPGSTAPSIVMVAFDRGVVTDAENQQALGVVQSDLRSDRAVFRVQGPMPGGDDRKVIYSVQLTSNPESDQAKDALKRIRTQLEDSAAARSSDISIGGQTASEVDFRESISDSMGKIILFILVVSFLVLVVLLRSLILPIVGVAMNVLCVGAAYGVLVAVFQWGWLPGLGLTDFGFVNSVILPLLLAIVFGLSMDYQVFLLTRIRERYLAGERTADAARSGTGVAGHTIAAAAAIMVAVFVVFTVFGVPTIQAAGLGAAVAVAASAALVQLAFMPALMTLLGDRVWWLPRWMDRALPRVELE
jgi:uncharacterized membrane protein YdfJ with MMPL/SSD domain